MAGTPETRYAKDRDSHHLAYQVVGDGPDLLFVPTATFPSFSRLISTDLLGGEFRCGAEP
jgi:hypothetical protein